MTTSLREHPVLIALAALVFVLFAPIQAEAAFNRTAAASTSASTATLSPPAGTPTVTLACGTTLLTQPTMTISWTVTPSTYATGYTVTPVLNNVAQTATSVTPRTATSVTLNVVRSVLLGQTNTYTFQVRSVYSAWTSTAVTTASASCPGLSI